jgi:hypothetical protein
MMPLDVPRALEQIAEIRDQATRADVYRGYRAVPVAASGLIGVTAAWLQPASLGSTDPVGFVLYWAVVAACAGLVGVSEIIWNYLVHDYEAERMRTRRVVGQFLPSVLAGAIISASFLHLSAALVPLLPGVWAICFGIGIFASRPFLPGASGWVALYYYAAGVVLLWSPRGPEAITSWHVGATFGVGQLLAALVLYWNLERPLPEAADPREATE